LQKVASTGARNRSRPDRADHQRTFASFEHRRDSPATHAGLERRADHDPTESHYSYDSVKIFMPAGAKKPVYAPYVEHLPPDVTAAIFWLKNRDPARWRDAWQMEHTLGKYVISDKPMTEEQWTKERATLIDVTPDDEKKE
jgi:hypothetical protein